MPEHRRRRATQRSAAPPIGPKGYGAASRLVTRPWKRVAVRRQRPATATSRFHRRIYGGMAPSSSLPLLGDAEHRRRRGALRSQTPLGTAPHRPRNETS